MNGRGFRWPPLLAALLLSVALHAVVLVARWMPMPRTPASRPVLEARLVPAPQPAVRSPPKPPAIRRIRHERPHYVRKAKRRVVARSAAKAPHPAAIAAHAALAVPRPAPVAPLPAARAAPPPSMPAVVTTVPPATVARKTPPPALPRRGRITYTLYYGTQKFEVGRTVQSWEFGNGAYRIGSVSETTGLVGLFHFEQRTYLSSGTVTAAGLRPRTFLMSRNRRGKSEVARARFDWARSRITWGTVDEHKHAALPPGSQDFLSLMYELALHPPAPGRISVPVTTGTRFATYHLDVLPERTIDTPLGPLRALPVREVPRPGRASIEIWLAAAYRYLPVEVRFYGRDGSFAGEQVASGIRLSRNANARLEPSAPPS